MVDLRHPGTTVVSPLLVAAVKQLWWGAMIVFININIGGWDLSSDIVGMALISWACYQLYALRPSDRFGQAGVALAVLTLVVTVLYSIPATAERFAWAVPVAAIIAQGGIAAVAVSVARRLRFDGLDWLASRWDATARWHVAACVSVAVFLGVAYLGSDVEDFGGDPEAVFEWAIASPIGLVTLTVSIALGVLASISWIRAAWALWK